MEINQESARLLALRASAIDLANSGLLQQSALISADLQHLLETCKKDPLSLISTYCASLGLQTYQFHTYDIPELTGQYHPKFNKNKFVSITEHEGQFIYGAESSSKKDAKKSCALRLLDVLMAEQKLTCINEKGRKIRKKMRSKLSDTTNNENFTEDVDYKEEFDKLNPIPPNENETKKYENIRDHAYKLYSSGVFNQDNISPATKVYLEASKMNPISFVSQDYGIAKPVFFTFVLPEKPPKFVALAQFGEEIYNGVVGVSKQLAKTNCALSIAQSLIVQGYAPVRKSKKRTLSQVAGNDHREQNAIKKPKIDQNGLNILVDEQLCIRTLYYIIINSKNPIVLLQEVSQKMKLPIPEYEYQNLNTGLFFSVALFSLPTHLPPTSFTGRHLYIAKIEGYIAEGIPTGNKKQARYSAARRLLDLLVVQNKLHINEPKALPIENSLNAASKSVFEAFRFTTYDEFQKSYHTNPLFAYSNSHIASIFLVDAATKTAHLISWATGNYYNPITYKNGEGLNDCDSAILCRRGLLRFLYEQLRMFFESTSSNSKSIFVQRDDNAKIQLRSHLSFHMYLSDSPSPSRSTNHNQAPRNLNPISEHKPFIWSYIGDGALSMKSCGDKNEVLPSAPMGDLSSEKMIPVYLSMSTCDKILKWNILGAQGALINFFISPIYFRSFVIENNYDANALSQTLVGRNSLLVPSPNTSFQSNQPYISSVQTAPVRSAELDLEAKQQILSLNWNSADSTVEMINPVTGLKSSGEESRLSRRQMFARFCKIYTNSGISDLTSITSYRNAKTKNTDYAYQFNEFKKTLQVNNLGNWVDKSQYPIDFKNEQLQLQD